MHSQPSFRQEYSAHALTMGTGMQFHPVSGEPLRELVFSAAERRYFACIPRSGWDSDPDIVYRDPIDDGADYSVGDPYPAHWLFDPWTGQSLGNVHR